MIVPINTTAIDCDGEHDADCLERFVESALVGSDRYVRSLVETWALEAGWVEEGGEHYCPPCAAKRLAEAAR